MGSDWFSNHQQQHESIRNCLIFLRLAFLLYNIKSVFNSIMGRNKRSSPVLSAFHQQNAIWIYKKNETYWYISTLYLLANYFLPSVIIQDCEGFTNGQPCFILHLDLFFVIVYRFFFRLVNSKKVKWWLELKVLSEDIGYNLEDNAISDILEDNPHFNEPSILPAVVNLPGSTIVNFLLCQKPNCDRKWLVWRVFFSTSASESDTLCDLLPNCVKN